MAMRKRDHRDRDTAIGAAVLHAGAAAHSTDRYAGQRTEQRVRVQPTRHLRLTGVDRHPAVVVSQTKANGFSDRFGRRRRVVHAAPGAVRTVTAARRYGSYRFQPAAGLTGGVIALDRMPDTKG